ncbi:MAG: 16S rRNA (cytosine(1402)-N(4))-methyltransferase RsmH [Acidobacteria bacterium]|nr:16S rRNA (cytosine(1402)-N(4))-methyltransferase RsmH [Acidobacteriota bacterium]
MAADHQPVMLDEVLHYLDVQPADVVVDCTLGMGGHAAAIAARLTAGGKLIARDRDVESLELARQRLQGLEDRIVFDPGKFSGLRAALTRLGFPVADRVLADCGISMYQLKAPQRGFSFLEEGPLDMRMGATEEGPTAGEIVNFYSEKDIAQILEAGEERRGRRIARAIVRARPVETTTQLSGIIRRALPPMDRSRIHPSTLSFQSLRLAVNQEMEELQALLDALPEVVKPGGRVVFLTFHSLEDRPVKQAFQRLAREGRARLLNRHVATATDEETRRNPAARSAKLRALEMTGS